MNNDNYYQQPNQYVDDINHDMQEQSFSHQPSVYDGVEDIELSIVMQEIQDVNQMPYRSMNLHIADSNGLANGIANMLSTGATELRGAGLQAIANDIICPVMEDSSPLITNGWQCDRYRFVITLRSKIAGLDTVTETKLTGYSDYADTTLSGQIDPNTTFMISSMTTRNLASNGFGSTPQTDNVISLDYTQDENYSCNPGNVFLTAAGQDIESSADSDVYMNVAAAVKVPVFTDVNTLTHSQYLAQLVNAHMTAVAHGTVNRSDALYLTASIAGQNNGYITNPFISAITSVTGNSYNMNTSFTWADMCAAYPIAPEVTNLTKLATPVMSDYESLMIDTVEASIASSAVDVLSGILSNLALNFISFSITNATTDDIPTVTSLEYSAYDTIAPAYKQASIIAALTQSLFPVVSKNNDYQLTLTVAYLQGGDANISLSLGGGTTTNYTIPLFISGITSPVVTGEASTIDTLASSTTNLIDQIDDVLLAQSPQTQQRFY